jgi:hypothetical protein
MQYFPFSFVSLPATFMPRIARVALVRMKFLVPDGLRAELDI